MKMGGGRPPDVRKRATARNARDPANLRKRRIQVGFGGNLGRLIGVSDAERVRWRPSAGLPHEIVGVTRPHQDAEVGGVRP